MSIMAGALTVYRMCLRCGPNISACERARGRACPAPKMTCASKESHDKLVEKWHEQLVMSRAAHYPMHLPTCKGDEEKKEE